MTLDDLRDWIAFYNPDALLADGFEDAVLGVVWMGEHTPVYLTRRPKED